MSYPVKEKVISSRYVNKACVFTQNLFISVSFSACSKEKRYFDISFFIKQSKTIKIHEISIDFLYLLLDIYKILQNPSISSIQSPYYINYIYFNDLHTTYCIVIIIFLIYLLIITNVICYYFDLLIIAKKDL